MNSVSRGIVYFMVKLINKPGVYVIQLMKNDYLSLITRHHEKFV